MGVTSSDFALFAGGDVVVNLSEHFYLKWNTSKGAFERRVAVYADNSVLLLDQSLQEVIGVDDFWPFVVWFEDPEVNDVYPDAVADLVRVPNKVINVWYSQMIENRTLRNFQMHWYDASVQNYQPQTYEPGPGRMLPAPGNPKDTIMPVEISGLEETLTAIDYLTRVIERGSGETAIDKGVSERNQITLGEVELLVGKSMERARGTAKFYRDSWRETAEKWDALMQANGAEMISLYKTGRSGKLYEKKVYASDWKSKAGYVATVASTSEQEEAQVKSLQKWSVVLAQYPDNMTLREISQKRQLELLDLTPQELAAVTEEEQRKEKEKSLASEVPGQPAGAMPQQQAQQQAQQQPQPPQDTSNPRIESLLGELAQLQSS